MIVRNAGIVLTAALIMSPRPSDAGVTAAPAMQIVSAVQIATLAERAARSALSDASRALVPAFGMSDQTVPAGTLGMLPGVPQINTTYVSVPIAVDIDGKLVRTVFAGFRITTYVRMAVAAHDLAAGAVLGDGDLTYAQVAFAGRTGLEIAGYVGRKMRSAVARGAVMYPEFTMVNEIVHAGMPALLIVHDGPVALCADVVARNSGGLGDSVSIFDPQTQRVLSGVVTGPDTVELTLPGAN